jgi:hypothetical protein
LALAVCAFARVLSFVSGSATARSVWLICLAAIALVWSLYAARAGGTRVVVDDAGVAIHNLLRTLHLAWDDVERFDTVTVAPRRPVAVVRIRNGRSVVVDAIKGDLLLPSPFQTGTIEGIVARMNGDLCRLRLTH